MKDLRFDLNKSIIRDNEMEAKFKAMRVYFLDQMPEIIAGILEFKQEMRYKLAIVDELWDLCDMGFRDRLDFIAGIEMLM